MSFQKLVSVVDGVVARIEIPEHVPQHLRRRQLRKQVLWHLGKMGVLPVEALRAKFRAWRRQLRHAFAMVQRTFVIDRTGFVIDSVTV